MVLSLANREASLRGALLGRGCLLLGLCSWLLPSCGGASRITGTDGRGRLRGGEVVRHVAPGVPIASYGSRDCVAALTGQPFDSTPAYQLVRTTDGAFALVETSQGQDHLMVTNSWNDEQGLHFYFVREKLVTDFTGTHLGTAIYYRWHEAEAIAYEWILPLEPGAAGLRRFYFDVTKLALRPSQPPSSTCALTFVE